MKHMDIGTSLARVAGVAAILASCGGPEKPVNPKPNIILIVADDLGYGDLGCFGQKKISTPNIDRLAANGMTFTSMYSGAPVSAPSRAVMFTGMHSGHGYVRGNMEADPYGQLQLPDTSITLAELLKTSGYKTALIGKWGLGVENTTGDPQGQGFDEFYGYYCQIHAHNSFPAFLFRNGNRETLKNEVVFRPKDDWSRGMGSYAVSKREYSNDLFCEEGLSYINYYRRKDFFLCLTFTIPHINGEAPAGQQCEVPELGIYEDSAWTDEDKAYAASITRLDSYVGRIVEKLIELGIEKKTLILFTSDNGAEQLHVFNSNGTNRGLKRDLYEGGIRVPFIAWMPGTIASGSESKHIAGFQDLLPTFCGMARVKVPFVSDGISLVPELTGLSGEQEEHPFLYWESHELGGKQAVRRKEWKAVRNNAGNSPQAAIELYNLSSDPGEQKNLADSLPGMVNLMDSLMRISHSRSDLFPFDWEKN
ncbi:MAG: arylsulfatase [Bacteroidales bacterium]